MSFICRPVLIRTFSSHGCKSSQPSCPAPGQKAKKRRSTTCLVGPSGVHPTVDGGYKIYRNLFFFLCVPAIGACAYNLVNTYKEPERQPFVKHEYLRIRHKKFPWCGGTDKSFFHNPHLNALPDGYEEEDEED